ncbi:hypothetical protein JT209_02130 [Helicobacter pylori]|nr:hypothetical protein [Helicobacter pylori]
MKSFPYNPLFLKIPLRVRYGTIACYASFFILIVKNTQRHQLIANTPLKTFYTLYKMCWNV